MFFNTRYCDYITAKEKSQEKVVLRNKVKSMGENRNTILRKTGENGGKNEKANGYFSACNFSGNGDIYRCIGILWVCGRGHCERGDGD